MTSILTNTGAIVALQNLKATNVNLDATQQQISTGKHVNTPADGSAVWAVTKVMESDKGSFDTIENGLEVASKVVSTAVEGANKITGYLKEILLRLVNSSSLDKDGYKDLAEIKQYIAHIKTQIDSSQVNGVNLLTNKGLGPDDATTYKVLASLDRQLGKTETDVATIDIEAADFSTKVYVELENMFSYHEFATISSGTTIVPSRPLSDGIVHVPDARNGNQSGLPTEDYTLAGIAARTLIRYVETIMDDSIKLGAALGAQQARIDRHAETVGRLSDAMEIGIGALVDTDLEEASARLKALQTQQQLGVQSLSIANQTPGAVLALFR